MTEALFVYNTTAACYWYNTQLPPTEPRQQQYRAAGWLAGQALHNRAPLGIPLAPLLWQKVLEGNQFQAGTPHLTLQPEHLCIVECHRWMIGFWTACRWCMKGFSHCMSLGHERFLDCNCTALTVLPSLGIASGYRGPDHDKPMAVDSTCLPVLLSYYLQHLHWLRVTSNAVRLQCIAVKFKLRETIPWQISLARSASCRTPLPA